MNNDCSAISPEIIYYVLCYVLCLGPIREIRGSMKQKYLLLLISKLREKKIGFDLCTVLAILSSIKFAKKLYF
jgi:hypothetical protein